MEVRRIGQFQHNYDMACENEPVTIEEAWGSPIMGTAVLLIGGLPILLSIVLVIRSIVTGESNGNPIGAMIFLLVIMGWPTAWGFLQFFRRRRFQIEDGAIKFEFTGLLKTREAVVKTSEYDRLIYGRDRGTSRDPGGSPGTRSYYFLTLVHKNSDYTVGFYRSLGKLITGERIQRYSEKLGLPAFDPEPEYTESSMEFAGKAKAFVEARVQANKKSGVDRVAPRN